MTSMRSFIDEIIRKLYQLVMLDKFHFKAEALVKANTDNNNKYQQPSKYSPHLIGKEMFYWGSLQVLKEPILSMKNKKSSKNASSRCNSLKINLILKVSLDWCYSSRVEWVSCWRVIQKIQTKLILIQSIIILSIQSSN